MRVSLVLRAILAIVLTVLFYGMALSIAGGLFVVTYLVFTPTRFSGGSVKLGLACLVGGCVILWSILPRRDRFEPPGPRLARGRHPRLFAVLDDIAKSVGQEMPEEVYLVPDVNAWVSTRGGMMGIGSRRIMGLGLPLLQALTVPQLRSVLGHEFGHYAGGDTALGPLVHFARSAVIRTLINVEGLESILALPFRWYAKLFLLVTHAVSRSQELAADRLAVRLGGAEVTASALKTVHGADVAFASYLKNEVGPCLEAKVRPPFAEGFGRFLKAKAIGTAVDRAIDEEIESGRRDPYDTHPPLRERLEAIAALPPGPPMQAGPPAVSLVDGVVALEKELLEGLLPPEAQGYRAISWNDLEKDEVVFLIWGRAWGALCHGSERALEGATPLTFLEVAKNPGTWARRAAGKKVLGVKQLPAFAGAVLGAALALALRRHGWGARSLPGQSQQVVRGSDVLEPFEILGRLISGQLAAEEWAATCRRLGIDAISLAAPGKEP